MRSTRADRQTYIITTAMIQKYIKGLPWPLLCKVVHVANMTASQDDRRAHVLGTRAVKMKTISFSFLLTSSLWLTVFFRVELHHYARQHRLECPEGDQSRLRWSCMSCCWMRHPFWCPLAFIYSSAAASIFIWSWWPITDNQSCIIHSGS